jgi:hypothetical protein
MLCITTLSICTIRGSHSGGYEDFYLLGYIVVRSIDVTEEHVTSNFRVEEQTEQQTGMKAGGKLQVAPLPTCFHAGSLLHLFFEPEDGSDMFFRKIG